MTPRHHYLPAEICDNQFSDATLVRHHYLPADITVRLGRRRRPTGPEAAIGSDTACRHPPALTGSDADTLRVRLGLKRGHEAEIPAPAQVPQGRLRGAPPSPTDHSARGPAQEAAPLARAASGHPSPIRVRPNGGRARPGSGCRGALSTRVRTGTTGPRPTGRPRAPTLAVWPAAWWKAGRRHGGRGPGIRIPPPPLPSLVSERPRPGPGRHAGPAHGR